MSTYTVVTTFNQSGYECYAKRMIQTFLRNWPETVNLLVYAEDCSVEESAPNLTVIDVATLIKLQDFKQRWAHDPKATGRQPQGPQDSRGKQLGIGFKWDAVRFSHKVYSVCDAAQTCETEWLIWMDADTVCHSQISILDIQSLIPAEIDLAYLGRRNKYSECGLYAMNLRSRATALFLLRFQAMYDHAENGIFRQSEWHDSFIFDRVRETIPDFQMLDWAAGIINGEGHPLINCEWGRFLDHLKGQRKQSGRSPNADLKITRDEAYWQ